MTVLEAAGAPGGKARALPSAAGPVDAGPTVLTMRWVFDDLARLAGARLEDHVTLTPEPVVARHWWPDGTRLDLHVDGPRRAERERFPRVRRGRVTETASPRAFGPNREGFFETYIKGSPMIETARRPGWQALAGAEYSRPAAWPALDAKGDDDRRTGGGVPRPAPASVTGPPDLCRRIAHACPALLSLIWRAEEHGSGALRANAPAQRRALAERAVGLVRRSFAMAPGGAESSGRAQGVAAVVTGTARENRRRYRRSCSPADPRALGPRSFSGPGDGRRSPRGET